MLSTKSFLFMSHLQAFTLMQGSILFSLVSTPQRMCIYYPLMFAFSNCYLLGFATIKVIQPVGL